jgi:hypothetical protein
LERTHLPSSSPHPTSPSSSRWSESGRQTPSGRPPSVYPGSCYHRTPCGSHPHQCPASSRSCARWTLRTEPTLLLARAWVVWRAPALARAPPAPLHTRRNNRPRADETRAWCAQSLPSAGRTAREGRDAGGGGQQASHTSANEIEVLVVGSQLLEGASLAEVHPLGDLHLACPLQLLRILDDEVVRGDILEGVDLVFGHVHRQTAGQRADYIFDSQ